jgi:hypothetical protein
VRGNLRVFGRDDDNSQIWNYIRHSSRLCCHFRATGRLSATTKRRRPLFPCTFLVLFLTQELSSSSSMGNLEDLLQDIGIQESLWVHSPDYAPSQEEKESVSELLERAICAIDDIRQEDTAGHDFLAKFRAQNILKTFITKGKYFVFPDQASSHRVPEELLLHIFGYVAVEYVHISENAPEDTVIPLWGASRTCTRWRSIILGTPELWSRISLSVSYEVSH